MRTRNALLSLFVFTFFSLPLHAQDTQPDKGFTVAEKELLVTAEQIAKDVARIRGLELKAPIKKGIKRRDELRGVLISKLAEEVSDEQIAAEGKVYARLGLIPEDLDYKKMLLDILTEQIAGFYDQKSKELYVMQGIPLVLQRPAMAHELFHAIQDQHFDILSLQEPFSSNENGDFALARAALIEGDATVVMFDFSLYEAGTLPQPNVTSVVDIPMVAGMLKNLDFNDLSAMESMMGGSAPQGGTSIGESALGKAPPIFKELLMFPYFAGMRFVVAARTARTWADIDAIYASAPISTEQILHPERYFAGDEPVHLDYDVKPALQGWSPIYDSVMGEFQVQLFLKTHLDSKADKGAAATAGATGWDGDRLLAWEKDSNVLVTHMTIWDSFDEANEYYDAMLTTMERRYPGAQRLNRAGTYGASTCFVLKDSNERIYLERWGDLVFYVEGAPSKLDEAGNETDTTMFMVRKHAFESLKRTPFRDHSAFVAAGKTD